MTELKIGYHTGTLTLSGELKIICEEGKRKNLTLQTTSCRIRSNYLVFDGPVDKDRNLGSIL